MKDLVQNLLQIAKETFDTSPLLDSEIGTTNVKGDRTIGMDVKIEELFIDYLKKNNLPVEVFSEEAGIVKLNKNPEYLVVFDPLDGSTNYKTGKGLLPYGTLVAIYKGSKPKLKDIVAAGALEYTSKLSWVYDGKKTTDQNDNLVKLDKDWIINQKTSVYFDLYYKLAYDQFAPLAQKVHIRWCGSNVGSLTYVLSEVAAIMGSACMRCEEIGAMYGLVKGAGGITTDHQGRDIGEEIFSPEKTYPMISGNRIAHIKTIKMLNENLP